jgi:hypothetical protein
MSLSPLGAKELSVIRGAGLLASGSCARSPAFPPHSCAAVTSRLRVTVEERAHRLQWRVRIGFAPISQTRAGRHRSPRGIPYAIVQQKYSRLFGADQGSTPIRELALTLARFVLEPCAPISPHLRPQVGPAAPNRLLSTLPFAQACSTMLTCSPDAREIAGPIPAPSPPAGKEIPPCAQPAAICGMPVRPLSHRAPSVSSVTSLLIPSHPPVPRRFPQEIQILRHFAACLGVCSPLVS